LDTSFEITLVNFEFCGTGFGLGLEGESGWSLGFYGENSEKIDFEDFPDQRVEGNRIIIGYRWR